MCNVIWSSYLTQELSITLSLRLWKSLMLKIHRFTHAHIYSSQFRNRCAFFFCCYQEISPRLYAFLAFHHRRWCLPSSWHFNVNPPGVHNPLSRDTLVADGANVLAHTFWFIAKTKLPDSDEFSEKRRTLLLKKLLWIILHAVTLDSSLLKDH